MAKALDLLGKSIVRFREAKEWTQADLAEATGRSVKMIQKLEYGKTNPSGATLDLLAKHLGVTVPELYGGELAKPSPAHLSLSDAARLLEAVEQASELRRAIVLAIAHDDPKYLDELEAKLPSGLSQGLRSISKAI